MSAASSYFGTMNNYFWYFLNAAQLYSEQGKRIATLSAFWDALNIFPTQLARQVIKDPKVRGALFSVLRVGHLSKTTPRTGN